MPDPVSGVLAAASIGGSIANIFGAQSAADAQKAAADKANATVLQQQQKGLDTQKNYFDQSTKALSGIANTGSDVYNKLVSALPDLTKPITMDQATLEQTPGYQFNLSQGERGVGLTSVGAGLSGAQAKAAAKYATGLADSTYQNQFNNANTNKQNAFNFLLNTAQPGISAAGTYGAEGTAAGNAALGNTQAVGNTISGNTIGAGNAQAAADNTIGQNVSNALTGSAGIYKAAPSNNPFGNYGMYGATGAPTGSINVGGSNYPAFK